MYGDGDPDDGLGALVQRRRRDQTVVGRLYHQLVATHLVDLVFALCLCLCLFCYVSVSLFVFVFVSVCLFVFVFVFVCKEMIILQPHHSCPYNEPPHRISAPS